MDASTVRLPADIVSDAAAKVINSIFEKRKFYLESYNKLSWVGKLANRDLKILSNLYAYEDFETARCIYKAAVASNRFGDKHITLTINDVQVLGGFDR